MVQHQKTIKELRKELKIIKSKNMEIDKKIRLLSDSKISLWETEKQILDMTHRFRKGDWVVLGTKEVAHIQELIGDGKYKVFIPCIALRGHLGITNKIHEKDILCHVAGLELRNANFKYSPTKWSHRPKDNP